MARQSTKSLMSTAAVAHISKCQPTSQKVKGHRFESHHLRGYLFLSSYKCDIKRLLIDLPQILLPNVASLFGANKVIGEVWVLYNYYKNLNCDISTTF